MTKFFMLITAPLSFPISKVLILILMMMMPTMLIVTVMRDTMLTKMVDQVCSLHSFPSQCGRC